MEIETAENKIIKMLTNQKSFQAIEEVRELFSNFDLKNISDSNKKAKKQSELEQNLAHIIEKYNLNEIAVNVFQILGKTFSAEDLRQLGSKGL